MAHFRFEANLGRLHKASLDMRSDSRLQHSWA